MRQRTCTILAVALLLTPVMLAAAQEATPSPEPQSLESFLASLPAAAPAGVAPIGVPEPRWAAPTCRETYERCLAHCSGNPSCEQLCQCDYFECLGLEAPSFCL